MAKYILSEENDELEIDLQEMKEFFMTEKALVGYNRKEETSHLLGLNSLLLDIPRLSLYDSPELKQKYPNGVVTENFVLIPADQFENLKQKSIIMKPNDPYATKKMNMDNLVEFFTQYMNAFVEVALNIELTEKDKEEISKDLKKYKIEDDIVPQPEKTTNRELLKTLEGHGYGFENVIKNSVDLTPDVKEVLKNNEKYLQNLDSIKQKVQDIKINEVNDNISVEEFVEMVDKAAYGIISPTLPLKIVNKKIDSLAKATSDAKQFTEKAEDNLLPFLVNLTDSQFKLAVENIFKNVFGGIDLQTQLKLDARQDLATKIANEPDCNLAKRDLIISVITGYDMISRDVRLTSINGKRRVM